MAQQISAETVAKFLVKTPLLSTCKQEQLVGLVRTARQKSYAAGAVMLQAGAMDSSLGFILQGRAALIQVDDSSGVKI